MKEAFKLVKGSWLRYILEFFVIIISIISAFMLDNWHNQRQEYRKETLTLIDISDALSFDLIDLKGNMAGHDAGIKSATIVSEFLDANSLQYHSERFNIEGRAGYPLNFSLTPRNPGLLQNDLEYKF